jgi:ABC-type multidrug transport system fused ATPase/permease subunit
VFAAQKICYLGPMRRDFDLSLGGLSYKLFRDFWPHFIGAFICLYGTHYVQSYLPFMAKEVADKMLSFGAEVALDQFVYLGLGIIFFRTFSRLLFFYPARIMQKELRLELLERLEKAPPSRYQSFNPGQLFQVMGDDIEQVRALFGFAYMQIGNVVIALAVLLPRLAAFNSELLITLIPMVVSFIIFSLSTAATKNTFKLNQEAAGELQNYIIESYKGKKTIKNYQAEKKFLNLFSTYSGKELNFFYKTGKTIAWTMPLIALGVGVSFAWGAYLIELRGMGANALILFSGFIFLFLEPLSFVSWIGVVFSRSFASWQRIKRLCRVLDEPSIIEKEIWADNSQASSIILPFWSKRIEFKPFASDKTYALIGETGCGKSELLYKLADYYSFKGIDLSLVGQSPYLFNDNILRNIFLGREETHLEREQAFELLCLFELDVLEKNRDNLFAIEVGEHGKELSGGQMKRLALIRSLFSSSSVILWDDPFSSIDLLLERQIVERLKSLDVLKDKTLVYTTHRLSSFKFCDFGYFLNKDLGIVEEGKCSDLLKDSSKVYEFFKKQMA